MPEAVVVVPMGRRIEAGLTERAAASRAAGSALAVPHGLRLIGFGAALAFCTIWI